MKLAEVWPTQKEVADLEATIGAEMFRDSYGNVFDGNPTWNAVKVPEGDLFDFRDESTYIQDPPFFQGLTLAPAPVADIRNARILAILGDSVTTDHISPAGDIALDSPAGRYLQSRGVQKKDFNSYGSRRGNDRVMVRGHLREHPPQEPDGAGRRGRSDGPPAERRAACRSTTRPSGTGRRRCRSW